MYFTHHGNKTTTKQAQGKIFWPGMRDDLKLKYENCAECQKNKQIDFAVKGSQNYLSMVCALTGFIKVFKTFNQNKKEAMRCVRKWAALYSMAYAIKADSGPSFLLAFEKKSWRN